MFHPWRVLWWFSSGLGFPILLRHWVGTLSPVQWPWKGLPVGRPVVLTGALHDALSSTVASTLLDSSKGSSVPCLKFDATATSRSYKADDFAI